MKAEKSSAKLQTEKSKSTFSDKKKNNKKKSQKKRLQKNRNAEIFKQNMQKMAIKADLMQRYKDIRTEITEVEKLKTSIDNLEKSDQTRTKIKTDNLT